MSPAETATVHASAVLVGTTAVLIRGPSGSGKSRLAFALILAGKAGYIPATMLIGDDRIHLDPRGPMLIARAAPALAGLIEVRGLGIRHCAHAGDGPVGLVVDLNAADAARLPDAEALQVRLHGIAVPRVPVGIGQNPLPLVIAALTTSPAAMSQVHSADCQQDIGNHMRSTLATSDP
jgi:serine kinase of HPr protein (carbohydrate metabolism regulator)